MKNDKFLIGIVIGIVVLVIVALMVVLLRRPGNESYIADDTPAGVVHNYFLAVQRKDYEKAYGYLSDDLNSKPNLDKFIRDLDNYGSQSDAALQMGETTQSTERAQVDVAITTYHAGGIFDSNTYTDRNTAYLQAAPDGSGWRLTQFPYPYWGYDWDDEK